MTHITPGNQGFGVRELQMGVEGLGFRVTHVTVLGCLYDSGTRNPKPVIASWYLKKSEGCSQGAHYGLTKEYTLNHIKGPNIFFGIFRNETILCSLGWWLFRPCSEALENIGFGANFPCKL